MTAVQFRTDAAPMLTTEAVLLEREAREVLLVLRCGLDDLASVLERLRQLRQRDEVADPRLIVEETSCARWEVSCGE